MSDITKQRYGWPDFSKPGVPMNPTKDGWHWVKRIDRDQPHIQRWSGGMWWTEPSFGSPKTDIARHEYLGPVLKPDEAVTALLREVQLKAALREMLYEATHLSPQEDDGSHWAKISKRTLEKARAALKDEPFR